MKGKRTGLAVKNPDNAHFSRSLAARETISETSNISTRWQPYLRMLAGIKRVRKLLHTNKTSKRSPPFPSFVFTMIVPFCDRGTKRTVINLNRQIYAHCAYLLYRHVVIAGRGQLEDFKETVTACLDNGELL